MNPREIEKQARKELDILDEYIGDFRGALHYCRCEAGNSLDGLSEKESEEDRLLYLQEEFEGLEKRIQDLRNSFLDLCKDVDSAICELESETEIFTLEEKKNRAIKMMKGEL